MNDLEIKAWQYEQKAQSLIKKMTKRGFTAYYAATCGEAKEKVLSLLPPQGAIGLLGSQTMNQLGVYAELRAGNRELVDHATQAQGLTPAEVEALKRRVFVAEAMLASSNAIDFEGRLYNLDGIGNRVAAMIYGPQKVILAIGMNKLAANAEEAWWRVRQVASPLNNKRLNLPNPCAKSASCHDCQLETSICNYFTVIDRSRPVGRIEVVLVGEDLGY